VIYSPAGFGQRLLAWLTSAPTPFAQIGQGYLNERPCVGICYTTGNNESVWAKLSFPIENYKTCPDFDRTVRKSVEKCSYWKNKLSM